MNYNCYNQFLLIILFDFASGYMANPQFRVRVTHNGEHNPQFGHMHIDRHYSVRLAELIILFIDFIDGPIVYKIDAENKEVEVSVRCDLLYDMINDRPVGADPDHNNPEH